MQSISARKAPRVSENGDRAPLPGKPSAMLASGTWTRPLAASSYPPRTWRRRRRLRLAPRRRHLVEGRRNRGVRDQGLIRLVGDLQDHVGVLDGTEPWVAELFRPAAHSDDVVARPPVPDVLAVPLEFGDQRGDIRVVRVPGGGQPEAAKHGPGFGLPFQVDLPGL